MYGDDACAAARNPNPTLSVCGLTFATPLDAFDLAQGGAPLLHASAPFKTVTAAVAYIKFVTANQGLPYTTTIGYVWKYAIIHCLPGVYGRFANPNNHPDTGLEFNGETFPIHLPAGVSVQGTNALNTVFCLWDGLGNDGPAFEFGVFDADDMPINGVHTFIDRISIYGAIIDNSADPGDAAAIVIRDAVASRPTITNCFLFRNVVGVSVLASLDESVQHHGVTIVNNTFAFNNLGIYNGQQKPPEGQPLVKGISKLIVHNNIFDSKDPLPHDRFDTQAPPLPECPYPITWAVAGQMGGGGRAADWVGIPKEDLEILSPAPWAGNYNAYEYNTDPAALQPYYNTPWSITAYSPTSLRNGSTPVPPPVESRNIGRYTGQFGCDPLAQVRGVLYVRDLFCSMWKIGGHNPSAGMFDLSAMDFRLSPSVAQSFNPHDPPISPGDEGVNPLINNGFVVLDLNAYPITMLNMEQLAAPPGYLPLEPNSQATWPYHAWMFDAEGFGNLRVHAHPANVPPEPPTGDPYGFIDIGADEVGDLIVAGYEYGTTTFASFTDETDDEKNKWPIGAPQKYMKAPDNKYVYHLGPVSAQVPSPPRPDLGRFRGQRRYPFFDPPPAYPWWYYYDAFTFGVPFWDIYRFAHTPSPCNNYYHPYAVEFVSTFVPYLLPDIHPWWIDVPSGSPVNINWEPCDSNRNILLYWNPSAPTVNPLGTYIGGSYTPMPPLTGPTWEFDWLDLTPFAEVPRIWSWIPKGGGPASIDGFDAWCRAFETGNPNPYDTMPPTFPSPTNLTESRSMRFSLETNDGGTWSGQSNVQSFEIVVQGRQPE